MLKPYCENSLSKSTLLWLMICTAFATIGSLTWDTQCQWLAIYPDQRMYIHRQHILKDTLLQTDHMLSLMIFLLQLHDTRISMSDKEPDLSDKIWPVGTLVMICTWHVLKTDRTASIVRVICVISRLHAVYSPRGSYNQDGFLKPRRVLNITTGSCWN